MFEGIERDSKRVFFITVENRTNDTLIVIIKNTLIFLDPNLCAFTNTIESTWGALKKSLPFNSTQKTLYDSYFSQYCIRKLYINDSTDRFTRVLESIAKVYNPELIKSD